MLTIHPRYWSFYSWVLDAFWAADLPRNRGAFREFYRPREALFAMACHVCDATEHATLTGNVVGSLRVRGLAERTEFDPQFDYIKEPLGGYGLYYRSTMEMMGVLVAAGPASGFPFDAPTAVGRALAAAFGRAVEGTALGRRRLGSDLHATVPRADVVEFARRACLCQLSTAHEFDLPLLQDLFLHAGLPAESASRRKTLRLILDLTQTVRDSISQAKFRELIYFRVIEDAVYDPHPDLLDVARMWRIYQAREYFSFAFNRLFGWVSRRGLSESSDGLRLVPMDHLWALVDEALDNNRFAGATGSGDPEVGGAKTPATSFMEAITSIVNPAPDLDEPWPRSDLFDEHALYNSCRDADDDADTMVSLLALVLLLYRRFGLPSRMMELSITDRELLAEGGSLRIGMARFFGLMHRVIVGGATMSELARWLIKNFVIVQHERVATSKLPDDTFRFRRVGDAIRFFAREAPAQFNDSRFGALNTTVHELGLVSALSQENPALTPSGRSVLQGDDIAVGVLEEAASIYVSDRERTT